MEISRDEFLKRELSLLCHHCFKKQRIEKAALRELPEKGFFDEMKEQLENIIIRET